MSIVVACLKCLSFKFKFNRVQWRAWVLIWSASVALVWVTAVLGPLTKYHRDRNEVHQPKCPERMAVSMDLGRMGNKFFEYMAARFISQALGMAVYITPEFGAVYDRYFDGRKTPIVDWDYLRDICSIDESHFVDMNLAQLPDLKPRPNNTHRYLKVRGFPVDVSSTIYKAIFSQRDRLISEFQWRPEFQIEAARTLDELKQKHQRSVVIGVHVRRTDYAIYLATYYGSHSYADSAYFAKAMDYFRHETKNPLFLVFSDDMQWCRDNLRGPDIVYAGNNDQEDPAKDLALMSFCDHLILSYGTFGMLAAWLNRQHGMVISAYNFTENPEIMVEALRSAQLPNWLWMNLD